ncbi:hypothetical protein GGI25_006126, partial [Coemansia spiralis]
NSDEITNRARLLVAAAKGNAALSQADVVELNQAISTLIESTFDSETTLHTMGKSHKVDSILALLSDMTTSKESIPLRECGIRSNTLVLRQIPLASTYVSSQGSDEQTIYSAHIVDNCLARVTSLYDETVTYLEGIAIPNTVDSASLDLAAETLQLALVIVESLDECLESMSQGGDGLLQSQAIWKSALEQCLPVATYLSKLFASSCRLFAMSTGQVFRQQQGHFKQAMILCKHTAKLIETLSKIFGSEAHLKTDVGMKRSLMERFCENSLAIHKLLLNYSPQFKVVWLSLCTIATKFSGVSFDSSKQCQKIFTHSCSTVRELASQTSALIARTDKSGAQDIKLQRRVKMNLASIRFIVFRMPSLLPKVRVDESRSAALTMLDTLFGELISARSLLVMPAIIAAFINQLVCAVVRKFTLMLFTKDVSPILRHLDALSEHSSDVVFPLIEGLHHRSAHCEIIRIICCGLDSISAENQLLLLAHPISIMTAFAMAVDYDILYLFLPDENSDSSDSIEQASENSTYQRLVASIATSARYLASDEYFMHWEMAVLDGALGFSGRSVGFKVLLEAWKLVAKFSLSAATVEPSVDYIVAAIIGDCVVLDQEVSNSLSELLSSFIHTMPVEKQHGCVKSIIDRYMTEAPTQKLITLCRVFPWDIYISSTLDGRAYNFIHGIAEKVLDFTSEYKVCKLDCISALGAINALVPAIRMLDPRQQTKLVEAIYMRIFNVLENCQTDKMCADSCKAAALALLVACAFVEEDNANSYKVLALCARNIDWPLFRLPQPAGLLAKFACTFAVFYKQESMPAASETIENLQKIIAHCLDNRVPWIAQHESLVQLLWAAAEHGRDALVGTLVRNGGEEQLVKFVNSEAAGKVTNELATQEIIYSSTFQRSIKLDLSVANDIDADVHMNGSSASEDCKNINEIIAGIDWLRRGLQETSHSAMPQGSSNALRDSLCALLPEIERITKEFH